MNDDRYILVIADGAPEMSVALEYACARSKKTGRKIIIATFIEPLDVLTTQGVTEIMKNEAREESERILHLAASVVKESTGIIPILHTREGELILELKKLIEEEEKIHVLVLAANANEKEKDPGPIIHSLVTKEMSILRIPVMIVPGNLSKEHISQIT